ncbi:heavy-metal-associated domain-containing protein [Jejuia pallidilutea]|uniref:Probable Co/Zn/Cd efflux system membrane fusion protein n=1 Tax=Jejuia pallidilutea TaxID=504487 RepID=A0A090WSC4_9FLAO|nr:heavy-metal-associated domain-containing protein [Jejuia pallidilutea]GAL66889.1 probable Co/Zn/Cd efflux system membrane fusion protein [Jejuia pallidilutea]GAL70322.1 probable Co/Zn/Cd efflux system membrane fusion protein [Jejuia pallidilutea]GAL90409.1 probable Co/Zn/Cd efflux system membrane fusion protein [Jejuia pallidilutea]
MKNIFIVALLLIGTTTFAQNKNAKTSMEVDGVCGMCKARIEKACLNTKGVKWADWSIDTHELKLIYDERKTDTNTIQKAVLAAGHDVEDKKATDEAYEQVHACCKYRDEDIKEAHDKENEKP